MTNPTIVGTPSSITNGGNYTPGAGSNRLLVVCCASKNTGARTLTNVVYNGVTRTPSVTISDSATANRDGVGICVFVESELSGSAQTVTATWSGASADISVFCYTVKDAGQSGIRTSGSSAGLTVSNQTGSIAQTVAVGDLQISVVAFRNNLAGLLSPLNSWTEDFDQSSGSNSGAHGGSHFTAVATSSPCQWAETSGGADDGYALATVAIAPVASASVVINSFSGRGGGAAQPLVA